MVDDECADRVSKCLYINMHNCLVGGVVRWWHKSVVCSRAWWIGCLDWLLDWLLAKPVGMTDKMAWLLAWRLGSRLLAKCFWINWFGLNLAPRDAKMSRGVVRVNIYIYIYMADFGTER